MGEFSSTSPSNISPIEFITSTRTSTVAQKRISNFMGHAVAMLDHLQAQNKAAGLTAAQLQPIYQKALERLYQIKANLKTTVREISPERTKKIASLRKDLEQANKLDRENLAQVNELKGQLNKAVAPFEIKDLETLLRKAENKSEKSQEKVTSITKKLEDVTTNLSKNEVKELKEKLIEADKEITEVIRRSQIGVATQIGEKYEGTQEKVSTLAQGGWGAKWIHFLALTSKTNQKAIEAFEIAQGVMEATSRQEFSPTATPESQVERDKLAEFKGYQTEKTTLDRRAGVIGLNGIYRFQISFSSKDIHNQFKSFTAQNLGRQERNTIEGEIVIDQQKFMSRLIPLNKEFDQHMSIRGSLKIIFTVFTNIFGTRGISSANRQEAHLINGWESNLIWDGQSVFRSLRHAITADRYEKNETIRAKNSKQAANELLTAALFQEIAAQGLTLEEAQKKGIQLNLNSVSLITPDDIRPHLSGQANERQMLQDQVLALGQFTGKDLSITLNGIKIPVKVDVNAFNFGVNALALSKAPLLSGLANQYELNLKAMEGFRSQVGNFYNQVARELLNEEEKLAQASLLDLAVPSRIKDLQDALANAQLLMQDIEQMMADKKAYLKGNNQYEIEAKILNLTNLMDQTIEKINLGKSPEDRLAGFKCAFNCMSGKDRTGILDGVAKTFAILATLNDGRYPSHNDLQTNLALRQQFIEILMIVLKKGGSLKLTEINTGAEGFKADGLLDMTIEQVLQAQGFSSTTSH